MNLTSPWRDDQPQRIMTIFRHFKKQSHRFMIIFSDFINQDVVCHSKIKALRYFRLRTSALAWNITHKAKTDKQRVKIVTKISEEVKDQFTESKELINERLEQESSKDNISAEEVIFLHV